MGWSFPLVLSTIKTVFPLVLIAVNVIIWQEFVLNEKESEEIVTKLNYGLVYHRLTTIFNLQNSDASLQLFLTIIRVWQPSRQLSNFIANHIRVKYTLIVFGCSWGIEPCLL